MIKDIILEMLGVVTVHADMLYDKNKPNYDWVWAFAIMIFVPMIIGAIRYVYKYHIKKYK